MLQSERSVVDVSTAAWSGDPLQRAHEQARILFAEQFPLVRDGEDGTRAFDLSGWAQPDDLEVGTEGDGRAIRFEGWYPDATPHPNAVSMALKSYLVLNSIEHGHALTFAAAVRYLVTALGQRLGTDVYDFVWSDLRAGDLHAAMAAMRTRGCGKRTQATYGAKLANLVQWLEGRLVIDPLQWECPVQKSRDATRTFEGRALRKNRLPTKAAIEALSSIYRRDDLTDSDRLLICAVGLLLVGGFRSSELLNLTADALVLVDRGGRRSYGIRLLNRKTRGTAKKYAIRWLSPEAAPLAVSLWKEIGRLTAPSRRIARMCETAQSGLWLGEYDHREWISTAELCDLLGWVPPTVSKWTTKHKICSRPMIAGGPGSGRGQFAKLEYLVSDVRRVLREKRSPLVKEVLGVSIPVSRMLFAVPRYFVKHGIGDTQLWRPSKVYVDQLSYIDLRTFLSGRESTQKSPGARAGVIMQPEMTDAQRKRQSIKYARVQSIYRRLGYYEPEDAQGARRPCRMRTHMLRHWINTLAKRGGMSLYHISMWMQRFDVRQTNMYVHEDLYASPADLGRVTQRKMLLGEMWGQPVVAMMALPPEERKAWTRDAVQVAYKCRCGICVKPQGVEQCDRDKACAADCAFHLRTRNDPDERAALIEQKLAVDLRLVQLERAVAAGRRIVPGQLAFAQSLQRGIVDSLSADDPTPASLSSSSRSTPRP